MDWKLLTVSFITLVVIVDPVGNAAVYLILTRDADRARKRRFADQAVAAATVVIFLFAFFGTYILEYLGISIESLMVAGGILLGIVALDMMKGKVDAGDDAHKVGAGMVPLGTPLLAGPGAVVASMLFINGASGAQQKALVSAGILGALLVVWLALRIAQQLVGLLRDTGVDLATRVMGILLAAIAVEFVYQAITSWIAA